MIAGGRFGRYEIVELLGNGGMGQVFRAHDTLLGRAVALKVLHAPPAESDEAEAMSQMLREARAAASLDHPNAVAIFDLGELEGQPYLAMELIDGATLRHAISEGTAPLDLRIAWLVDVALALAAAHKRRIVHRDVKPENVMVRRDGIVKVLDFGIARTLPDVDRFATTRSLTLFGARTGDHAASPAVTRGVRGTPAYMAPEQLRGEPLDGRADQFAWGVLAYELLTGEHPWQEGDLVALARDIVATPAPPLRARNEAIAPEVERVIARALAKSAADRYPVMDDLAIDLARAQAARSMTTRAEPRAGWGEKAIFAIAVLCMLMVAATPAREPRATARAPARRPGIVAVPTEAMAAYDEGQQLFRDGSRTAAIAMFDRAATLDPTFAAAHLHAAMLVDAPDTAMRSHLQSASQHRRNLSARDAELLFAHQPWASVPADWKESERRLVGVARRYPEDAEVVFALGRTRLLAVDYPGAIAAFDQALSMDPELALAWQSKAFALLAMNDLAAARDAYERCLVVSPASRSCLGSIVFFLESEGQCAEEIDVARRMIALAPNEAESYRTLANAEYGAHGDVALALAAMREANARTAALVRTRAELASATRLAVLAGDLARADVIAQEWENEVAPFADESEHVSPAWYRMTIANEIGRRADAAASGREYLRKREGWTPVDNIHIPSIYVIQMLYRSGAMDHAEMAKRRGAWLEVERRRDGHPLNAMDWTTAYAELAVTREDAIEALSVLPEYGPLPNPVVGGMDFEIAIGETYRLAGRIEESIPHLRGAARSCEAVKSPFQHVWASLHLGEAREALGDVSAACSAFRDVVAMWGRPRARYATVEAARAGIARLHCL
jgi:tetratricopeptide (TPR) repeat protein